MRLAFALRLPGLAWIPVWRRNFLVWQKLFAASVLGNLADPLNPADPLPFPAPDSPTGGNLAAFADRDTFYGPLTLKETWRRTHLSYEESVCADDGGLNYFHQKLEPIPEAATIDF